MKLSRWFICLGLVICQQLQSAPLNVKITGFSTTNGETSVQLEVQSDNKNSPPGFISLKPGESHGNLKLLSIDPAEGEVKIQQDDKVTTLSLRWNGAKAPTKVSVSKPKPVQTPPAKLHGMTFADGKYTAFFEISNTSARGRTQYLRLEPGQREGSLEFVRFDPGTGQSRIRENGQERLLDWTHDPATLHFENVPVSQVLDLFGHWQKKSWAAASSVLGVRITARSGANDSKETALDLIKKACRKQDVILMEASDRLILAGSASQEELMTTLAENFPKISPDVAEAKIRAKSGEMVPWINFDSMPLAQVLEFYSDMVGRTVLRGSSLPITTFISFRGGPLTKEEAIAALDADMALNGIKTIPASEKFLFVTTQGQAESVHPIAEKLAQTLERAAAAKTPTDDESKVPLINFDNMRMAQVCVFYAELAGRNLDQNDVFPNTFVTLKSKGPLSKTEALAALDAVLALNGVELVQDGETGLKLLIHGRPASR